MGIYYLMSPVWAPHGIIIYIDIVLSGISYAYLVLKSTWYFHYRTAHLTTYKLVTVCLETTCVSATNGTTNH